MVDAAQTSVFPGRNCHASVLQLSSDVATWGILMLAAVVVCAAVAVGIASVKEGSSVAMLSVEGGAGVVVFSIGGTVDTVVVVVVVAVVVLIRLAA